MKGMMNEEDKGERLVGVKRRKKTNDKGTKEKGRIKGDKRKRYSRKLTVVKRRYKG